jgi:hypothetical protein
MERKIAVTFAPEVTIHYERKEQKNKPSHSRLQQVFFNLGMVYKKCKTHTGEAHLEALNSRLGSKEMNENLFNNLSLWL